MKHAFILIEEDFRSGQADSQTDRASFEINKQDAENAFSASKLKQIIITTGVVAVSIL